MIHTSLLNKFVTCRANSNYDQHASIYGRVFATKEQNYDIFIYILTKDNVVFKLNVENILDIQK